MYGLGVGGYKFFCFYKNTHNGSYLVTVIERLLTMTIIIGFDFNSICVYIIICRYIFGRLTTYTLRINIALNLYVSAENKLHVQHSTR